MQEDRTVQPEEQQGGVEVDMVLYLYTHKPIEGAVDIRNLQVYISTVR